MMHADFHAAWRRVQTPTALTLAVMLAIGILMALAPEGVTVASLQPADSSLDASKWARTGESAPAWAVAFFVGDTLYALCLAWTFLRLRQALPGSPVASIAIGAAFVKAGADVGENLLYLWPVAQALFGEVMSWPPIGALASLAMIKRAGGVVTGLTFAFALPGESWRARCARLLLAALGAAAALGFFMPSLALAHAALIFAFLAYLLWYRRVAADDY